MINFGGDILNYTVNLPEVVIPGIPTIESDIEAHATNLTFAFRVPENMVKVAQRSGLNAEVRFRSEFHPENHFTRMEIIEVLNGDARKVSLPGLTPYGLYEVEIRLQSRVAKNNKLWSKSAKIATRTLPMKPEVSPEINQDLFESIPVKGSRRKVVLHWEDIPDHLKNGPDFAYAITDITFNGTSLFESGYVVVNDAKASFTDLPMDEEIQFQLASKNLMGLSDQRSVFIVPPQKDILNPDHCENRQNSTLHQVNSEYAVVFTKGNQTSGLVWKNDENNCTSGSTKNGLSILILAISLILQN